MYLTNSEDFGLWAAVRRQRRVLFALMLRNIRNRFFGNGLGYLVGIAWPLTHILILVIMYSLLRRVTPYGSSMVLFIATGVVPFMVFAYLARMMMLSVLKNRALLAFPEVRILDILIASAVLEVLAAACVIVVLILIALFFGIDPWPRDLVQFSYALGAAVLVGLGVGVLNSVIVLAVPAWFTGYTLLHILLWLSAGVLFVPDNLPQFLREIAAYQPVLQVIEWTRASYYEGYGQMVLDRSYPLMFGCGMLFLGLLVERAIRGAILAKR